MNVQEGHRFNNVTGRYVEVRVRFPGSGPGAQTFSAATLCNLKVSWGLGDCDCDGYVTSADLPIMAMIVAGIDTGLDCDPMFADMDSDGEVTDVDYEMLVLLLASDPG